MCLMHTQCVTPISCRKKQPNRKWSEICFKIEEIQTEIKINNSDMVHLNVQIKNSEPMSYILKTNCSNKTNKTKERTRCIFIAHMLLKMCKKANIKRTHTQTLKIYSPTQNVRHFIPYLLSPLRLSLKYLAHCFSVILSYFQSFAGLFLHFCSPYLHLFRNLELRHGCHRVLCAAMLFDKWNSHRFLHLPLDIEEIHSRELCRHYFTFSMLWALQCFKGKFLFVCLVVCWFVCVFAFFSGRGMPFLFW